MPPDCGSGRARYSLKQIRYMLALILLALAMAPAETALAQPGRDPAIPTGPEVGAKIPEFEAVDQTGKRQTFETLKGPKGLLLLFYRSADW